MNPLAALAITYLLITICSASILYFSFNGKIDASGKYFFFGELTIIPGIIGIVLSTLDENYQIIPFFIIINTSVWISQVCVLFSIKALSTRINHKKFIVAIFSSIIYAAVIEIFRHQHASIQTTTFIASITDAIFCFWTYGICQTTKDKELRNNIFFNWIKNIEFMLGLFALVRVISCFVGMPINARLPTSMTIVFYTIFLILNVFRYISYQSLRISWIDYKTNSMNPLNRNLAAVTLEKNNLLQGLMASNRVIGLGALASSLAHQLSQPLTAIGLQVETLKRDLSKSGKSQDAVTVLEKVNSQLAKLTNLVKNLRQLFNTNSSDFHEIDIASTANELMEIIEPTLETKKIRLIKNVGNHIVILGDAIQIQQVLINLLNNAIEAISISNSTLREIKLTINANNQHAVINIQDSGNGIDTEILPTMFELLKTTKRDGLGVGLWLSKTIISKHHGEISASNIAGGGALVTIHIPLIQASHEKS